MRYHAASVMRKNFAPRDRDALPKCNRDAQNFLTSTGWKNLERALVFRHHRFEK
jgi:hypothetical protein